jgi:CHAD domain-containing protein
MSSTDPYALHLTDSLAEAGRKILLAQFQTMLANQAGTVAGEDIEFLHDMRVATRRMRAAFEIFAFAYRPAVVKQHLRGLRATGRALGAVRDWDVFLQKSGKYRKSLTENEQTELVPLFAYWEQARQTARASMLAYLSSPKYSQFKENFGDFVKTPALGIAAINPADPQPTALRLAAPMLVYDRLARVLAYDALVESATIEQLHALRVTFKKLRYALEFLRPLMDESAKGLIGDLKKMQDHLGDLNDADVACNLLDAFLHEAQARQHNIPAAEHENLAPVFQFRAHRQDERHTLVQTFPARWQAFRDGDFRPRLAAVMQVF